MKIESILKSKNLQNSFWNIIEVLITPLIFFISIPVFLNQLGKVDYGIWVFVNSVIVLMQVFNLGLNLSTYKHVCVAIADKNQNQISRTLNTNLSLTFFIFIIALFTASIIALGIQHYNWFIEPLVSKHKLITCLFLGMGILFVKLIEQILYSVFRAYEEFKYITLISLFVKVILVTGNILIAFIFQNIIYIFVFSILISLVGILITYKFLLKFIPSYTFSFILKRSWIKYEINYSFIVWMQSISVIIVYQGDRILVSYYYGISALTFYAIVASLINHLHMFFGAITVWIFPQVAKMKSKKEEINDMYINTRNISITLSVVILAFITYFSAPLFTLWLGLDVYTEMKDIFKWFCVFEFFFIFTIIPHYFFNASDNEKLWLKWVVITSFINVVGIIIGNFIYFTEIGIVVGLALSTIFTMYFLHFSISSTFLQLKESLLQVMLLFIPSVFGSLILFFDDWGIKTFFLILCILSAYLIYVKHLKTNFKTLFE